MSVTITVRLGDGVRARLADAAHARGVPPSSLAGQLIVAGLDRPPVPDSDGPLVATVREQLAGADPMRRELGIALARQVESGATSSAARLAALLPPAGEGGAELLVLALCPNCSCSTCAPGLRAAAKRGRWAGPCLCRTRPLELSNGHRGGEPT